MNIQDLKVKIDPLTNEKQYVYDVLYQHESDKKCDEVLLKITNNGEIDDAYYTVSPKPNSERGWEVRKYFYKESV